MRAKNTKNNVDKSNEDMIVVEMMNNNTIHNDDNLLFEWMDETVESMKIKTANRCQRAIQMMLHEPDDEGIHLQSLDRIQRSCKLTYKELVDLWTIVKRQRRARK